MKNLKKLSALFLIPCLYLSSCNDSIKETVDQPNGAPLISLKQGEYQSCDYCEYSDTIYLPSIIDYDYMLSCDNIYVLDGKTFVTDEVTLTIPAGTQIEGVYKEDPQEASALVITRGCKIIAEGSESCPIIFTAFLDENNPTREAGDWGGLVILGNAPVNQENPVIEGIYPPAVPEGVDYYFGGTDCNDNSGILSYVRVEYAGAAIEVDNELNAFTFGGVGCGTILNHLEAYQGADDGYEFFGGTVCGKYLLANSNNDDQFDFDFGYRGTLQFCVAIINPSVTYASNNTNGIECDNDGSGSGATPITRPIISNMTIVGPPDCVVNTENQILNACRFRRNSRFVLNNSIFFNFPSGILLESSGTINSLNTDCQCDNIDITSSYFWNNVVYACNTTFTPAYGEFCSNSFLNSIYDIVLENPTDYEGFFTSAGLAPKANPALSGTTYCDKIPLPCGGTCDDKCAFEEVDYKGAIDPNYNWLSEDWIKYN